MSGLPFLFKVIEKVVSQQLTQYDTASNLNEQYQYVYRRQHSTETALLKIMNDLLLVDDNQQLALMTFLDLSAVFDTVDHSMLLLRLQSMFGVSGDALSGFASYPTGRIQSVKIGSVMSKDRVLKYCVPQGSVLGPQLYCDYTIPLGTIIRNIQISFHMYADDSQIYKSVSPSVVEDN